MFSQKFEVRRKDVFKMKSGSPSGRQPIDSSYILDLAEVEPGIYLVEYPNAFGTWLASFQGNSHLLSKVDFLNQFSFSFSIQVGDDGELSLIHKEEVVKFCSVIEYGLVTQGVDKKELDLLSLIEQNICNEVKVILGDYKQFLDMEEGFYDIENGAIKCSSLYIGQYDEGTYIVTLSGVRMAQSISSSDLKRAFVDFESGAFQSVDDYKNVNLKVKRVFVNALGELIGYANHLRANSRLYDKNQLLVIEKCEP
ncbi:hypothetical protein [Microbulbifer sp. CNSA002]|uniref:hypothetical protein n=1 Tax=unclassified Microbulbifer TaxID=2619833 RepID=UPI0039B3DA69